MSETILVTGGAGYVGSHACQVLASQGWNPVVVDDLSTGHEWAVQWGAFEKTKLQDVDRLEAIFKEYRPSAVMHFAASALVEESVGDPGKYYENNVGGTLSLLQVMERFEVSQLVFSSSAATYGVPRQIPISETHSQEPINPYGRTKLMMEQVLKDYSRAGSLQSVSLRYFNAAGADPNGKIGEDHEPESHLIPLVLRAATTGAAVKIFGTDYDTPDGTCVRDFVHVMDLARAHVLALEKLRNGHGTESFNLGTKQGYSVKQVIETSRRVTGKKILAEPSPRRPGDPDRLVADCSKAEKVLGWVPEYSLEATIEPCVALVSEAFSIALMLGSSRTES